MRHAPTLKTLTVHIALADSDDYDLDTLVSVAPDTDAGVVMSDGRPVLVVQTRDVFGIAVVDLSDLVQLAARTMLAKGERP